MAFGASFMGKGSKGEKKLQNKSYYKSLIDNKHESAFLVDYDGDVLLVNRKALDFTGYSEEAFLSLKMRDIFVTLSDDANPLDSSDIRDFEKELFVIKPTKYLIPVLFNLSEIEGGKFLCTLNTPDSKVIIAHADDKPVTTPTTEKSTGLSEEDEHTARNSLNTILGFSNILIKESAIKADRKLMGYIKSIINNGNKLRSLLNLSESVKSDNSNTQLSKIFLNTIVNKVQVLLQDKADQNSIELMLDIEGDYFVMSDESVLTNVLNFIIEKAITYCRGMFVDIKVDKDASTGKITIIVDNLGQDIPMSIKNFIKSEYGSISYNTSNDVLASDSQMSEFLSNLNSINAKIKFKPSDDFSDIAIIELPSLSSKSNDDDKESEKSVINADKRALVIEDDKLNAIILKNHLQQFVKPTTAFSGNEALNIIEMMHNEGNTFDIIFTDIGLPEPWDGFKLKEEIIKRWPQYKDVPFVAQTGYSAASYSDKIRESGFAGYLIKPINRNDIKKFVSSL